MTARCSAARSPCAAVRCRVRRRHCRRSVIDPGSAKQRLRAASRPGNGNLRLIFRIQISNSHSFSFSRRRASWAFSFLPYYEGRRRRRKTHLGNGRGLFPDCRRQRHTATPLRRLRRGDFFDPGTVLPAQARASSPSRQAFAHPSPVPSSHLRQSPVVGSDGYPRPPGSMLARHGRGRRIRPVRVTPPAKLSLCPTSVTPLEAPLTGQDTSRISEVLRTGIGIHSQLRERPCVPRTQCSALGSAAYCVGTERPAPLFAERCAARTVGRNKRSALRRKR